MLKIINVCFKVIIAGAISASLSMVEAAPSIKPSGIENLSVISYHNITKEIDLNKDDYFTITEKEFISQLNWLKTNKYHVVSFDDYLAAKEGKFTLQKKSVLLTFDDGFKSHFNIVYPLLKEYGYTGVFAIVGSWIAAPESQPIIENTTEERSKYMSIAQLTELASSSVAEIASHSFESHKGHIANSFGNLEPALASKKFSNKEYESEKEYENRVLFDLKSNSEFIQKITGKRPRAIVWPYGSYTLKAERIAEELGMTTSITLESPDHSHKEGTLTRILMSNDLTLEGLSEYTNNERVADPVRVMHVDMDYIYDKDMTQVDNNLSVLLDRIKASGVNTVFLQAYADSKGDSLVNEVYFPSTVLHTKADLLNRVTWQIRTRTGAKVFAWMPIYSYDFKDMPSSEYVKATSKDKGHVYKRISPFSSLGKQKIIKLYSELAQSVSLAGILFHDDGVMTDYEDFSAPAKQRYKSEGIPQTRTEIKNKGAFESWSKLKENAIYEFTDELTSTVKEWQTHTLLTARNMYAPALANPYGYEWTAQSYNGFSAHYDYVAVMAMPYMEKIKGSHSEWLKYLAKKVKSNNTIFELQSVDWKSGKPIPAIELKNQMATLKEAGLTNFGYYPDDFVKGIPDLSVISEELSLNSNLTVEIK